MDVTKLNVNGTQKDIYELDKYPRKDSDNLIATKELFTHSSVIDISELNATENPHTLAKYENLSAALSALPPECKRGGMTIRYVQTSDNKYEQYRLMSDSFSTTEADWQGVDDVPQVGSDNLVKSGGVKEEIQSVNLLKNIHEDGFYICDENGKAIVRLDILDSKNKFGPNLLSYIDAVISQKGLINTIEDGFYICNENGDSIAEFKDNRWIFLNAKREIFPGGINVKKETLTTGEELYLTSNAVSLYQNYAFSANIGSNFTKFSIFHGRGSDFSGCRIDVDSTYLKIFLDVDSTQPTDTFEHHLTLKNTIQLTIDKTLSGNWANHIRLVSNGQSFQVRNHWTGQGDIYVTCEGTLKDCSLSWACRNLLSKVWAFGDSYFSRNVDRWVYYLLKDNYTNVLLDAYPGGTSAAMYAHLISLLELGKPDTIVWCLGMNDGDYSNSVNANWYDCYNNLRDLCEKNSINLILSTIPNVPGVRHDYKNEIVRNSGFRYIDFEKSVGATELNSNWFTHTLCAYKNGNDIVYTYHTPTYHSYVGENVYNQNGEVIGTVTALDTTSITYNNVVYAYSSEDNIDGMLSYDDIHPGISGAKTLYGRAIADAPELMSMEAPQYQSNN